MASIAGQDEDSLVGVLSYDAIKFEDHIRQVFVLGFVEDHDIGRFKFESV